MDYQRYYEEGKRLLPDRIESFTSANTKQLNLEETVELLKTIPEIQVELRNFKK